MRVSIKRCDFCGADHSAENPVSLTIGGVKTGRKVPTGGGIFGLMSGTVADETADLDMCAECAAGLLDIVRAAIARRRAANPPKPKPAHPAHAHDAMHYLFGIPVADVNITDYQSLYDDDDEGQS